MKKIVKNPPLTGVMFCVRVISVDRRDDLAVIEFKPAVPSYPGQFVMVNVFGYEEIPLSLSSTSSLAVKAVGETTRALVEINEGEILGIRGPFGRSFTIPSSERILMIAGGIGVAPLKFLYDIASKDNDITFVYGAKTADEIIFKFKNAVYATEDGSLGMRGTVIDALKTLDISFDRVYYCGSEEMMREVWKYLSSHIPAERFEVSMERYMRCGFGVCGSCSLENGLLVCRDGPVFSVAELSW